MVGAFSAPPGKVEPLCEKGAGVRELAKDQTEGSVSLALAERSEFAV